MIPCIPRMRKFCLSNSCPIFHDPVKNKKKQKNFFHSKLKKSSSAANKEVASGINFNVPQKGHLKFSIIQGQN